MDNYNKNYNFYKNSKIYNKKELFNHLLKIMPKEALYAYNKNELKFKRIGKSKEVIKKANFLFYNQNLVTELVFDIDEKYDLETIFQEFLSRTGITPTWICSTARGAQLCISLNTFYKLSQKQLKVLKDFKRFVSENWKLIDKAGSNRLSGWWRNPLTQQDFIYTGWITTFGEIKDFLTRNNLTINEQFKKAVLKKYIQNNIELIRKRKFFLAGKPVRGNRNKWLWYNTMFYTNSKNFNEVLEVVKELHNQIKEPLEEEELTKITKSVLSYNLGESYKIKIKNQEKEVKENRIYGWNVNPQWNIGIMGFKKIRRLPYQEYLKEVKRRQSMAGKKNSEIGTKNLIKAVKKKAETAKNKVYIAIEQLKKENKRISALAISKISGVSRNTATKYLKQAKEEGII